MQNDNFHKPATEGAEYQGAMKNLSDEEKPREKALRHGFSSLTSAELLAILLGSGTVGESVVELSRRILKWSDNSWEALGQRTIADLKKNFKGVGDAKAITIQAAMEIGKRYAVEASAVRKLAVVRNSEDAYALLRADMANLPHEEFWVMFLNNARKVIGRMKIGQGGVTATVADVKIIIKGAIDNYANAIIVAHNHPSGEPTPSRQDDALTEKIKEAAKYFDITLLDHIIVCRDKYYSFADNARL